MRLSLSYPRTLAEESKSASFAVIRLGHEPEDARDTAQAPLAAGDQKLTDLLQTLANCAKARSGRHSAHPAWEGAGAAANNYLTAGSAAPFRTNGDSSAPVAKRRQFSPPTYPGVKAPEALRAGRRLPRPSTPPRTA